jgi:hypothetical protein
MFITNDGPDRLGDISNVAYCDLEEYRSIEAWSFNNPVKNQILIPKVHGTYFNQRMLNFPKDGNETIKLTEWLYSIEQARDVMDYY